MLVLDSHGGCHDLSEGEAREVKLSASPKTVLKLPLPLIVVQILILVSARIVCNIVYVQVRDRIHRELCCEN